MDQPYTGPNLGPLQRQGAPVEDPWAEFSDKPPDTKAKSSGDPWADFSDKPPPEKEPGREVGTGEALARGVEHGVTFGLSPAISGANAAANPDIEAAARKFGIDPETAKSFLDHMAPTLKTVYGAGRLAVDAATGGNQTPAQEAYSKQRADTENSEALASEQHPIAYPAAEIVGSVAAPVPGIAPFRAAAAGAKLAARMAPKIGNAMVQGGTAGGMFGAGEAAGEGKPVSDVLKGAAKGEAIGGVAGGVLGGILGPRAIKPATTPGEKAAETAVALGAPLPKGLASDSPFVQSTAQQASQIPIVGKRIGARTAKTVQAAGNKVGEIVDTLTPTSERSATDLALQTPLENAITGNKSKVNTAYDAVRNAINPDQRFPMPKTANALYAVKLARERAGWDNPGQGLEQAQNLVDKGGGFNGAHRARVDMREAGKSASPHPGYNKGDFNRITAAIDADMKNNLRKASTDPNQAESLFNTAEMTFGQVKAENDLLQKLLNAKGEGGISELLGAGKEKGGNLALLAQIKGAVPKASFERISGTLLDELGHNTSTGKFSLNQFTSGWDKLSDSAKGILFSPDHRKWIDDIAQMGRHIKGGDQYANTSNTAGALIMFDVVRAAGEAMIAAGAGYISPGAFAATAGSALAAELLTRYMASPAKAASMSAWARAYRGITLNQPTPARIAAFRVTTRNLANNVNLPMDRIIPIIDSHLGSVRGDQPNEKKNNRLQ